MRSYLVVTTAPVLNQNTGFLSRSEPLLVHTLIANLPSEALIGAVLPGLVKVVRRVLDTRFSNPRQDRVADEVRAAIRTRLAQRSTCTDQTQEQLDDPIRSDAAGHIDGKALTDDLIHDGQSLDSLTRGAGIKHEVIRPHRVRPG
jgi:hypothetical protein